MAGPTKSRMPDITQAQVLAVVGWIIAQAIAYGVIDDQTAQVVLSSVTTLLAAAWTIGDAWIRRGRAEIVKAAIESPTDTKQVLDSIRS